MYRTCFLLALLLALSGCAQRTGESSPREDAPSTPAAASQSGGRQELDGAALLDLQERMLVLAREGPGSPEGLDAYVLEHEDFSFYPSEGMQRLLGVRHDGYRYGRVSLFMEAHRAGRTDAVALVYAGEPLPFMLELLRTREGRMTVERCRPLTPGPLSLSEPEPVTLSEDGDRWVVKTQDQEELLRIAKYGVIPELIAGEPRGVTREEAMSALAGYLSGPEWMVEADAISPRDEETVCGESCYVFETGYGSVFAVTKDLACLYVMEMVNGNYVLVTRPAPSTEAAGAARFPEGPIRRSAPE